ncbi:LysR substrate-binding domain-containing protein [Roseomonas sp. GC11]|uniref:LysR substrate-binding domain-containing protein n=1 Tax=Roseomonas sp. GC11 TaxID=2950546 RepID=UPI00210C7F01|nr:LysR substrate-binding domain-containing protein [Roseomonas sp. GC11]MCQ4158408.1 LysR substrate-binding domain-containing protein [Roseomonas sp. GC11]
MELRHLRAFLMVAETLHFARAAERLGLSAPALTEQVQALERHLGARLFRRSKRSVALSDAGALFRPEAEAALRQVEQAERTGRQAGRGERGIIGIGFAASAAFSGVLAASLGEWRRAHPEVLLRLQEMETVPQVEAVASGALDIGFIRPPFVAPPGVTALRLRRERLLIALPEAHPLAARAGVSPAALAGEDFIVPDPEKAGFHHFTRQLGERGGFTPRIAHGGRDLVAVASLVGLGLGVAVVPDSLRDCVRLPGLAYRPLAGEALVADIAAVFRRNEAAPAAVDFIRQLRQIARDMPPVAPQPIETNPPLA